MSKPGLRCNVTVNADTMAGRVGNSIRWLIHNRSGHQIKVNVAWTGENPTKGNAAPTIPNGNKKRVPMVRVIKNIGNGIYEYHLTATRTDNKKKWAADPWLVVY